MEAKNKIIIAVAYSIFFFFLIIFGSGNVISPFFGDINLIDEGQYGAWVRHMLHGEFLYKDTYAAYGPLLIYPLYLLSKVFGPSFFLIRILYGVLGAFFALVVVRHIMKSLKISLWLQMTTCFLSIVVHSLGFRQGIGLLVIYLAYKSQGAVSNTWSVAAGIALSASFLISSEIGLFSFIIIIISFLYSIIVSRKAYGDIIKLCIIMISALSVFALFSHWSLSEGWFSSYITTVIDDYSSYSGIELPIGKALPNIFALANFLPIITWIKLLISKEMLTYWVYGFYVLFIIISLVKYVTNNTSENDRLVFSIMLFGFFLSLILVGRSGHLPFVLAPMFILFAYYLQQLIRQFTSVVDLPSKALIAAMILVISLFSLRIVLIYRPHFSNMPNAVIALFSRNSNIPYLGSVTISPEQQGDVRTLQAFVKENTKEAENIFFFTNEPGMYLLVNRGSPTRFDLPEVANVKEKRMEMVTSIEKDKTKYIFENINAWSVDGVSNRKRLPEVYEYILQNYSSTRVGNYIVYRRNGI